MDGHCCWNCKLWFEDRSVGVAECTEQNMTEEEYDIFCVNFAGNGCPYFDPVHSDEELEAIKKAEEEMIDFWDEFKEEEE